MSRIRADKLVNRAGSGGPKFPNGVADGFSIQENILIIPSS